MDQHLAILQSMVAICFLREPLFVSASTQGIPSIPRSVHVVSYEWEDTLYWRASRDTGGLPVHYTVTALCPNLTLEQLINLNCQENQQNIQELETNITHVAEKEYSLSLESEKCEKCRLDLFTTYSLCVVAVNEFGEKSHCLSFRRSNFADEKSNQLTIPAPVSNFTVIQPKNRRELRLSWKIPEKYAEFKKVFIDCFTARDKHNITIKNISNKNMAEIIPNIKPNSLYECTARSQYYISGRSSVFSTPSVVSIYTRAVAPEPPQSLACSWNSFSWKPPANKNEYGKLKNYSVQFLTNGKRKLIYEKEVNATTTSSKLHGLTQNDSYTLQLKACNNIGCSAYTDCRLYPPDKQDTKSNLESIYIAVGLGALVLAVGGIVALIVYKRRKLDHQKSEQQARFEFPYIDGPICDQYHDAENVHTPNPGYTQVDIVDDQRPLI